MIGNLELIIRLLLSAIVGGAIGIEREVSNRPAGLRTHILVSVGASLITLISQYSFTSGDPSRVAAQIVSGIGFLGAGTILRTGDNVTGLTTAASLWVCAGIGMAIGGGFYVGAIATAAIVLLSLMFLAPIEKKYLRNMYGTLEISGYERPGLIGDIGTVFGNHFITIKDIKIDNLETADDNGKYRVIFTVKLPVNLDIALVIKSLYEVKGVLNVIYDGHVMDRNKY